MRLEMLVTSRNVNRNPRWSKFILLFKWAIQIETLDDHRGFRFAFQWPLRISIFFFFFCLFVEIKPENPFSASCVGREVNPREWSHTGRGTNHVRTKDSDTYHVLVNLWLTLYKLTGWLASLDLRQPYTKGILSHRKASPHALFDELVSFFLSFSGLSFEDPT